jgi:hypothetical protein
MIARNAAILALASCATTAEQHMQMLQDAVDGYNSAYRWKNYERAASYLPNDLRAAFIASYEDDEKSLHVEGYTVIKVDLEGETGATVKVRMRYLLLPSISVETRTLTQHWHKIGDSWILETEENSIRVIEPEAQPQNPEAVKGVVVDPEKEGETSIEVTDPAGKVIKNE